MARPFRATRRTARRGYDPLAPVGTRYTVHTAASTHAVEETGGHWTPGSPIPEGAQPNALLALARCAELAASNGVYASGGEVRAAA